MPSHIPPSSSRELDPELLDALAQASTKQDVRCILQRYDTNDVHAAWQQLPLVQRAALQLVRFSDGRIFHELDNTD